MESKLIICIGSGGVGKTSVSAAVACKLALEGKKVFLISIDPAKRLAQALGLQMNLGTEQKVIINQDCYFDACILDAKLEFQNFVKKNSKDSKMADALLNNSLFKKISEELSGSQEFTALIRIHEAASSKRFDYIVVDTPPAQHAIEFLQAPQKLYALFANTQLDWLKNLQNKKPGFLGKLVYSGTYKIFEILESLVGNHFLNDLQDFFALVGDLGQNIQTQVIQMQKSFASSQAEFWLISNLEKTKLISAREILFYLDRNYYRLSRIILNRSLPNWNEKLDFAEFKTLYQSLVDQQSGDREELENLKASLSTDVSTYFVPELRSNVDGLQSIQNLAKYL